MILLIALILGITAPPAISREKGAISVSEKTGKPRWTAEWTMEPAR